MIVRWDSTPRKVRPKLASRDCLKWSEVGGTSDQVVTLVHSAVVLEIIYLHTGVTKQAVKDELHDRTSPEVRTPKEKQSSVRKQQSRPTSYKQINKKLTTTRW